MICPIGRYAADRRPMPTRRFVSAMVPAMRNWAGNLTYRAARLLEPESVEELAEVVRGSRSLRVLGSRHAFSSLADTTATTSRSRACRGSPRSTRAPARSPSTARPRYGDLAPALTRPASRSTTSPSLPHISIAGACATATHGSGDRSGNLSTAVLAWRSCAPTGELVTIARAGRGDFQGLSWPGSAWRRHRADPRVEPAYDVRQWVYEDLPADAFRATSTRSRRRATASAASRHWRGRGSSRSGSSAASRRAATSPSPPATSSARAPRPSTATRSAGSPGDRPAAARSRRAVAGAAAALPPRVHAEQRRGAPVRVLRRRGRTPRGLRRHRRLRERIRPLLLVSEIRTVAADGLWLSPAYDRDSLARTSRGGASPAVRARLAAIEAALADSARGHTGRSSSTMSPALAGRYERLRAFADSRGRSTRAAPSATTSSRTMSSAVPPPAPMTRAVPRPLGGRARGGRTLRDAGSRRAAVGPALPAALDDARGRPPPGIEVGAGRLVLRIDEDQPPWSPEFTGELRVSSLQTGVFAGPEGSAIGQHRWRDGLVVREAQRRQALHADVRPVRAARPRGDDPTTMVALWMIGYEDEPERSAEICICRDLRA